MVWLRLNERQEIGDGTMPELNLSIGMFHTYKLRVTNGWREFHERISVLDAELYEDAVEILKFLLWPQVTRGSLNNYDSRELSFVGIDRFYTTEVRLQFVYLNGSDSELISYPKTEYDKFATASLHKKLALPDGRWARFDYQDVLRTLKENGGVCPKQP